MTGHPDPFARKEKESAVAINGIPQHPKALDEFPNPIIQRKLRSVTGALDFLVETI